MPDLDIEIDYTVHVWKEDQQFIAHAMPLYVMSAGPTAEMARQALEEAVGLFLKVAADMGTLDDVLEESGYQVDEGRWTSPPWVSIERHVLSVLK